MMDRFDEEDIQSSVEDMVDDITQSGNSTTENPREKFAEQAKDEGDVGSKIPRSWNPVELDFLLNNRTSLGNRELEEFLREDSELHQKMEELSDFSATEQRFLLENCQAMTKEQLADRLDRDEEIVELKMQIMGLEEV